METSQKHFSIKSDVFSDINEQIEDLTSFLESDQSDDMRQKIDSLILQKADICKDIVNQARSLFYQKRISHDCYMEICDEMSDLQKENLESGLSWYSEAVSARAYNMALTELTSLSILGTKILGGYMLSKTGKKYVRERLSKYTILNEDAINCNQLTAETFTIEEATDKFHITFQYAQNWEKSGQQTHCKVWFYDKKPVITAAYNRAKSDNVINSKMPIETKILDSRFKKHEDYYTAYMCCELQMNHPCIKRILTKLKQQWKEASKKLDKDIQDEINESVKNGTIDMKYKYVEEAGKSRYLTDKEVKTYLKRLNVQK